VLWRKVARAAACERPPLPAGSSGWTAGQGTDFLHLAAQRKATPYRRKCRAYESPLVKSRTPPGPCDRSRTVLFRRPVVILLRCGTTQRRQRHWRGPRQGPAGPPMFANTSSGTPSVVRRLLRCLTSAPCLFPSEGHCLHSRLNILFRGMNDHYSGITVQNHSLVFGISWMASPSPYIAVNPRAPAMMAVYAVLLLLAVIRATRTNQKASAHLQREWCEWTIQRRLTCFSHQTLYQ
jgi:hypothetical protein